MINFISSFSIKTIQKHNTSVALLVKFTISIFQFETNSKNFCVSLLFSRSAIREDIWIKKKLKEDELEKEIKLRRNPKMEMLKTWWFAFYMRFVVTIFFFSLRVHFFFFLSSLFAAVCGLFSVGCHLSSIEWVFCIFFIHYFSVVFLRTRHFRRTSCKCIPNGLNVGRNVNRIVCCFSGGVCIQQQKKKQNLHRKRQNRIKIEWDEEEVWQQQKNRQ